jgi:N-acetylglucosamine-6-phosphate deacetylase
VIVLSGADLVLPDRIVPAGTLVIDGERIADIRPDGTASLRGHTIVPGLIDVHVHGVDGVDSLDPESATHAAGGAEPADGPVHAIAAALPHYGVTAFCPTTACSPEALGRLLGQVRRARESPSPRSARVLPAHLESNFINPAYRGAQPASCLRQVGRGLQGGRGGQVGWDGRNGQDGQDGLDGISGRFTADDILREIDRAGRDVGIVTLAPELDGGMDLIGWLTKRGLRVSLGHSGATYEQALAAIAAGARRATHLFNCMPALHHRTPTLPTAILDSHEVAAEVICDGVHVHPAVVRMVIATKGPHRIMAITDGTSASGLPVGARASLGGRTITAGESAAFLDDGTLAGSVMTMDRVLRALVVQMGVPLDHAVTMCSAAPARELGLDGQGAIAPGGLADLVVLDRHLSVVETYVGGRLVYSRNTGPAVSV